MKFRIAGAQMSLKELGEILASAPQPIRLTAPAKTEAVWAIPSISTTSAPVEFTTTVERRILFTDSQTVLQVNYLDLSEETLKYFESKGFSIRKHRDGIDIIAPSPAR